MSRHPVAEELVAFALDAEAVSPDVASHLERCALCRSELEDWTGFFAQQRASAVQPKAGALEHHVSLGSRSSETQTPDERRLVDRILAKTTRQDLTVRGDLRLIRGFLRERLSSSPALRLIAASLVLHLVLALPISAFVMVMVHRGRPPLQIRVANTTEAPFAEDVPEPEWFVPELSDVDADAEEGLGFLDPRRSAPDQARAASERLRRRGAEHLRVVLFGAERTRGAGELSRELWARSPIGIESQVDSSLPDAGSDPRTRLALVLRAERLLDRLTLSEGNDGDAQAALDACMRALGAGPPPDAALERLEAALYARAEGAGLASARVRARYFLLRSRLLRRDASPGDQRLLNPALRAPEPLSTAWLAALERGIEAVEVDAQERDDVRLWSARVRERLATLPGQR